MTTGGLIAQPEPCHKGSRRDSSADGITECLPLADARAFCERFFTAYKHEHRHSGIGMHTLAPGTQSKQLELADNSDDWEWVGVRRRCDQSDSVVHNVS